MSESDCERRHLGAGRALPVGNREQPAVEDRVGLAALDRKMDMAREPLPGLVHEAAALVEEAVAGAVHHDPVWIEQDHRRGARAARVDRLDVHAVPLAGGIRAERLRHGDTVAGVEARPRRQQRDVLPARPEVLAHHAAVALEPAAGEHHRIGGNHLAAAHPYAADRTAFVQPSPSHKSASAAHAWRKATPASWAARVSSRKIDAPPPTGWMRGGPLAR